MSTNHSDDIKRHTASVNERAVGKAITDLSAKLTGDARKQRATFDDLLTEKYAKLDVLAA